MPTLTVSALDLALLIAYVVGSRLIFAGTRMVSAQPSHDQVASLTWSRAFWQAESRQLGTVAWYRNYRFQSAGLLALALIIVVAWW